MSEQELTNLEQALLALKPIAANLERDRLLFRLGQSSQARRGWWWPLATGVASVTAAVLGIMVWTQPVGETKVKIVYVQVPTVPVPPMAPPPEAIANPPEPASTTSPSWNYWKLQKQVLRFGDAGFPESSNSMGGLEAVDPPPLGKMPTAGNIPSSWRDR